MPRRRSSLLTMGHVLLEAADATLTYLKSGLVSVLVISAFALVLFELLGALIVGIVQWATSGTVAVPDALQLQLSVVTPISCGLVTLLTIANLLRLVAVATLRAARTAVTSARLNGMSEAVYDADFWSLPMGASPYYVVPTPALPSLPTQPLVQPLMPYRQARPEYYVQPWSAGTSYYPVPATPDVYGYRRRVPTYVPPVEATPYASVLPTPYGYSFGTLGALYPVSTPTHAA